MIVWDNAGVSHGAETVFAGVSLRIQAGERVGIVGPNGSGKTTLFDLITGRQSLTEGEIRIEGSPAIGLVRQVPAARNADDTLLAFALQAADAVQTLEQRIRELSDALSETAEPGQRHRMQRQLGAAQTEFEHLGGYGLEARVRRALGGLGFAEPDFARPFASFSGGWRMRAELVRTLAQAPDLLLLDEPSNYLDSTAVEWLQRFLRAFRGTLLLISHDRFLLQSLTAVTLEVDAGTVTRYEGDLASYQRERVQRHETLRATRRNLERKRTQMERFITRFRAQSSKAAQVQSRCKALARLPQIALPRRGGGMGGIRIAPAARCGAQVIRLEGVAFAYDPDAPVLRDVSLALNRGDRVAVVGYNGMGKTTLLRLMAGRLVPGRGRVIHGYHVVPGYLSQAFEEMFSSDTTLFQCLRVAAPKDLADVEIRSVLGSFGFSGEAGMKPCGVLSGGERIRLAFAQLFVRRPNCLILDEPTTHLDLEGRIALERALAAYEGTLCMVSHDVAFLSALATRVLHVEAGHVRVFDTGYKTYREADAGRPPEVPGAPGDAPRPAVSVPAPSASARDRRRERAAERARTLPRQRALQQRMERLETQIMALEAEQAARAGTLTDGAVTDHAETNRRLRDLQSEIDRLTRAWEQAGLALETLHEAEPHR